MQRTTPHTPLSSKDNSTIKTLRALADPKHRKKQQSFLIEGVKMVEEALARDLGVKLVVAATTLVRHQGKGLLKIADSRGVEILWISERLMRTLAESKTPQPVMAVVKIREHREDDLLTPRPGLVVVAHQLQDPGNLGTIVRTAEAVGAAGVALTENTVDPFNAKAVRASMGSILRLPVIAVGALLPFLEKCRTAGFQRVATTLAGDRNHFDIDFTKPTAMILGREGRGLSGSIMEAVDLRVRIPMAEAIDSLNVATAAAVLLYEALRQRRVR